MSRDRRDGFADGAVSVPPVRSDDDETTPLGVKLFCAVGAFLGISHVTFLTEAVATGRLEALVVFTAFGVLCGWLLYGLWTRRRWAWVGTMCWFAVIGALDRDDPVRPRRDLLPPARLSRQRRGDVRGLERVLHVTAALRIRRFRSADAARGLEETLGYEEAAHVRIEGFSEPFELICSRKSLLDAD